MTQPWQVSHCTTSAAFWGESGRTTCLFSPLFVCLKSCRTTWSCAVPKANSVVLQHCNPEPLCCSRHAVCMLWWLACPPVVRRQGRFFFFPWVPESVTPLVILQEAHFSWSAVGCVPQLLRAPEGGVPWRGIKGLQAGIFGVASTFWMPACWEASRNGPHMRWCLTHLRAADRVQAWRFMAMVHSGSKVVSQALLSFWQHPGICEKAACFSHVSEGLAEFLGCFLRLPASSSHEMSAGNELQECSWTHLRFCAAMATSAKP